MYICSVDSLAVCIPVLKLPGSSFYLILCFIEASRCYFLSVLLACLIGRCTVLQLFRQLLARCAADKFVSYLVGILLI